MNRQLYVFGRIVVVLTLMVSLVGFVQGRSFTVEAQEVPPEDTAVQETPPPQEPPVEAPPSEEQPADNGGTGESTPPGSGETNPPSETNPTENVGTTDPGESAPPTDGSGTSEGSNPEEGATPDTGTSENGTDDGIIIEETPASEPEQGTGGAEGISEGGGSLIVTGDANASANVVNVVNANIIDSEGFLAFLNMFGPYMGNVSVENFFFPLNGATCAECSETLLNINNLNNGDVINELLVAAITGQNVIRNNSGDGTIVTGNANAAANLVNIVNTNIIGSNYLLLMVNNFSSWVGDLIFPGADYFENFLSTPSGVPENGGSLALTNDNTADVVSDVETGAGTGENAVEGDTATIVTGDASAAANTHTIANANILDNHSIFILVRVFGKWSGDVFGTPPGMTWEQTPEGIALHNVPTTGSAPCCEDSATEIANTNTARLQNRIRVFALTGANQIQGAGNGVIATGDAHAVANTVNLVNTNIVGRNWLFAIINIFGDWTGNLAFGQPDLWVGERANLVSGNPLTPGTEVTYTIDIVNRGNSPATQVRVRGSGNPDGRSHITDFGGGAPDGNNIAWTIPAIQPGGSVRLTYRATVSDGLPLGVTVFENTVSAEAHETDANMVDNTDSLSFAFQGPDSGRGILPSDITVKKTNSATHIIDPAAEFVSYKIVVKNEGAGWANDVAVRDTLFDPWGTVVTTSTWFLGVVAPHEEIIISYDTNFSPNASSGYYYNYVSLDGFDNYSGTFSPGYVASSTVYIVNPNDPVTAEVPGTVFVPPPPASPPSPSSPSIGESAGVFDVGTALSLLGNAQAGGEEHVTAPIGTALRAVQEIENITQSPLSASLVTFSLEIWDHILLLLLIAGALAGYKLRTWI